MLLNYRTSGGEVPYANYLPGIADSILGDYRSSYPGNPFFGKIAALRVTKRYLEVPELLYASDSADPSTDRVLLHVRVDELPDGEPVTLLKGKSRDTADGVMSYLGINDASTKMSSSAVIPRKNVLYSGSERVGENVGSLKTFVTDGEGVDKRPTCSYRWAANGGVNARIAERGFTVETFFCLSSLDPEEATREEVDVFHVDTSDNANGFATGFRSTGSHFFAWYPSYKEDGTVEDRTYVWVSFADKNLSPPTDKKWHHLALSWDESAKKLRHYYDYTLVYEAECPYGVPLKLTAFQVGSNSFVRRLLGWLDEFRVTAAPLGPEDFLRFRSDLGQIMIIR